MPHACSMSIHVWRLEAGLTSHACCYLMLHGALSSCLTQQLLMKQLHKIIPKQQGFYFCHKSGPGRVQMSVLPDGELNEFAVLLDQLSQLLLISQLTCILLEMKGHPCAALQRLSTVVLLHLQRTRQLITKIPCNTIALT